MIPVSDLYKYCKQMLAEQWGYIWGTAGVKWTAALQNATTNDMAQKYGKKWIGHTVADCSGVMVYIWKQHGLSIYHGSNTIARKYVGALTKTPQPGYAAFKWRSTDTDKYPDGKGDYYHIGIVAEDGKTVYEAKSTQVGFTTSDTTKWQYFAPFKDVGYSVTSPKEPIGVGYVNITSGSLNMREEPNANAHIIGTLKKDQEVKIIDSEANGWYYIQVGAQEGYVSAKYIKLEEKTVSAPAPQSMTYYGVFIPCENEDEVKKLQNQYSNSTPITYSSANGEDG